MSAGVATFQTEQTFADFSGHVIVGIEIQEIRIIARKTHKLSRTFRLNLPVSGLSQKKSGNLVTFGCLKKPDLA